MQTPKPMPYLVLLSTNDCSTTLRTIDCLREISDFFKCGGVKYEGDKPHSVTGYKVRASVVNGYVALESTEFPEDFMRIAFAEYLEEHNYVESLVAEYKNYKVKSFISNTWHKNKEASEKWHKLSSIAIEKAYDKAWEMNMPKYIIDLVKQMRYDRI
jgi:hypothetical protein